MVRSDLKRARMSVGKKPMQRVTALPRMGNEGVVWVSVELGGISSRGRFVARGISAATAVGFVLTRLGFER